MVVSIEQIDNAEWVLNVRVTFVNELVSRVVVNNTNLVVDRLLNDLDVFNGHGFRQVFVKLLIH